MLFSGRLALSLVAFSAVLSATLPPLAAQSPSDGPTIKGLVTATGQHGPEAVNGVALVFSPSSVFGTRSKTGWELTRETPTVYPGAPVEVYGELEHKKKVTSIRVERVDFDPPGTTHVRAEGVVDWVGPPTGALNAGVVRAGGYLLRTGAGANITDDTGKPWTAPVTTNLWISFEGEQQLDGTVLLRGATVEQNEVLAREQKLLKKSAYDPAAVPPEAHQSGLSRAFRGIDPRQLPPYPDAAMQARVDRIGRSVIPEYQRSLPKDDLTRVDFRFQVVELDHIRDALTLPNGIILVPKRVVDLLQGDTELATVLADNVGTALEKQSLRLIPTRNALVATNVAGTAAGVLVPGLGLATMLGTGAAGRHEMTLQEQQSGRVSLGLLHDAGYDITRAPLAWWRLAAGEKPMDEVNMPARALNLYQALGTTWRPALVGHGASAAQPGVTPPEATSPWPTEAIPPRR